LNELNEDKKKYQIALSLIEGVGGVIGKKLLAFTGSAKAVFFAKRSELEKIEGEKIPIKNKIKEIEIHLKY
jgi:excinuclease UvrABC nuclease subunit